MATPRKLKFNPEKTKEANDGTFYYSFSRGNRTYTTRDGYTQEQLNQAIQNKPFDSGHGRVSAVMPKVRGPKGEDKQEAWDKYFLVVQNVLDEVRIGGSVIPNPDKGKWEMYVQPKKNSNFLGRTLGKFDTEAEANAAKLLMFVGVKHSAQSNSNGKFEIVRRVSDRKRVKVVDQEFDTRDAAMAYMIGNAEEIINVKKNFGEEVLSIPDRPLAVRNGPEFRTKDAEGKDFLNDFAVRGVEFGNWQSQNERKQILNHAYDGLQDMADVIGVDPKSIGLDGELSLAFGSRGQGLAGARAHYERATGAINLTKMKGAGSLAHEWMHGLDAMLARMDDPRYGVRVDGPDGGKVFKESDDASFLTQRSRSGPDATLSKELRKTFTNLIDRLGSKEEKFTQDTEQAERFVQKVADRIDTQLSNLRAGIAEERQYGRRKGAATADQLERFDRLAKRIKANPKTESRLLDPEGTGSRRSFASRETNDDLEEMNSLLEEVTGRGGFRRVQGRTEGDLARIASNMRDFDRRSNQLAALRNDATGIRKVPTSFSQEAQEIDRGRVSNYWSTRIEMVARAFQAYIDDRLVAQNRQSEYLNRDTDNAVFRMLHGIAPFPEGQEREEFNELFDDLFAKLREAGVLKSRTAAKSKFVGVEIKAAGAFLEFEISDAPAEKPKKLSKAERAEIRELAKIWKRIHAGNDVSEDVDVEAAENPSEAKAVEDQAPKSAIEEFLERAQADTDTKVETDTDDVEANELKSRLAAILGDHEAPQVEETKSAIEVWVDANKLTAEDDHTVEAQRLGLDTRSMETLITIENAINGLYEAEREAEAKAVVWIRPVAVGRDVARDGERAGHFRTTRSKPKKGETSIGDIPAEDYDTPAKRRALRSAIAEHLPKTRGANRAALNDLRARIGSKPKGKVSDPTEATPKVGARANEGRARSGDVGTRRSDTSGRSETARELRPLIRAAQNGKAKEWLKDQPRAALRDLGAKLFGNDTRSFNDLERDAQITKLSAEADKRAGSAGQSTDGAPKPKAKIEDTRKTRKEGSFLNGHSRGLEKALGTDSFQEVFDRLKGDKTIRRDDMIAIARRFAKTSPKSKSDALKDIFGRHHAIVSADDHRRAVGSRIAG